MYTFVDFSGKIVVRRGFLVPQTRGSHTPIWCLTWLLPSVCVCVCVCVCIIVVNLSDISEIFRRCHREVTFQTLSILSRRRHLLYIYIYIYIFFIFFIFLYFLKMCFLCSCLFLVFYLIFSLFFCFCFIFIFIYFSFFNDLVCNNTRLLGHDLKNVVILR
jgi:hypothetical protein